VGVPAAVPAPQRWQPVESHLALVKRFESKPCSSTATGAWPACTPASWTVLCHHG